MPVVADAGADVQYVYGDLPIASEALTGNAAGGSGTYVTWSWYLLDKPDGSAAALDDPGLRNPHLLNVDLPGTYMLFLVVEDDLGEFSEAKRTLAPDSAYVHIRVSTENRALNRPASGERNYSRQIHDLIDKVDDVDSGVGYHLIEDHDTSATGAELDTLTDGSNADALHVHAALNSPASTIANGVVMLSDPPDLPATPVVLNKERFVFEAYVEGTIGDDGAWIPGLIEPTTVTPQSQAVAWFVVYQGLSDTIEWRVVLADGGATGGSYEFKLYDMTYAQFQTNDWAGATLLSTITEPHSNNAPLTLQAVLGPAVTAGHLLVIRCTDAPDDPGGKAYVAIHAYRSL